jgi:glycerate kinase
VYLEDYGVNVADLEGAGAAGGLAGCLAAAGATLESGFDLVAEEVDLLPHMERADFVVTGEGFLDAESFDGKVVGGVLALAGELGVPALVIAGELFDAERLAALTGELTSTQVTVVSLVERYGEDRSRRKTLGCIHEVVTRYLAAAR